MANLISREAAIKCLYEGFRDCWDVPCLPSDRTNQRRVGDVRDKINALPIVDAVGVVRCKDCRNLYDGDDDYCCKLHVGMAKITPYSFCSYGERKETG